MILDFKEIPAGNGSDGTQDSFEFFAREFLVYLGYNIVEGPDRGADGGRDLIVEKEARVKGKPKLVRYIVSCKHKAHDAKGSNVGPSDEANPRNDMEDNNCKGFIGFYSTGVTARLGKTLDSMAKKWCVERYDPARIERELFDSTQGKNLAWRFFPKSMRRHYLNHPLYPEIAAVELAKRASNVDDNYSVGLSITDRFVVPSMNPKRPDVPPASMGSMRIQFDPDRDQDKIDGFNQLLKSGVPFLVPRENISSVQFHPALTALFPSLQETPEYVQLLALPSNHIYEFDLLVESGDGEILGRYEGIAVNKVKGGSEEFDLSNAKQGIPLVFEMKVRKKGKGASVNLGFTTDYKGLSVSKALKVYEFVDKMREGTTLRFVHPHTEIGKMQFKIPRELKAAWMLPLLRDLEKIQNLTQEVFVLPERALTSEEMYRISLIASLLPTGKTSDIQALNFSIDFSDDRAAKLMDDIINAGGESGVFIACDISEENNYELFGHHVYLGPVFTLCSSIKFALGSLEAAKLALSNGGRVASLQFVPAETEGIRRYCIERMDENDLEFLKSIKMPEDYRSKVELIYKRKL